MKQVVLIATLAALSVAGTNRTLAGSLDKRLAAILDATPGGDHVKAVVYLTEQVDIGILESECKRTRARLHDRHETVVLALQATAQATQGDLLAYLNGRRASGAVTDFSSFWIVNAIAVEATPAELRDIAARDDVATVYHDFKVEFIEPVDEQRGAGGMIAGVPEPGVEAIRAPEVWALGIDGAGTLVSSLDTGTDGNHEALRDRWRGAADPRYAGNPGWAWFDPLTNTTFPFDASTHGTHTMGSICGGSPGDAVGVAPGAHWITAGVIDRGTFDQIITNIMAAFEWIIDPDGDPGTSFDVPDVNSNSWGVPPGFFPDCDDRFWVFLDNCEAAGIVMVFAAGNEGMRGLRNPAERASDDFRTFAVAAVDANNPNWPIADFSSRGPTNCTPDGSPAIKPDISGPGVQVRSCEPGNRYGSKSGTSMSTPHVAGVVALLRQADPDLPVDEIKRIIFDTAVDLGGFGEDNSYGWGMIDAFEAVSTVLGSFEPGDLNCDGDINSFDIESFLVALFDPGEYPNQYPDCDIELADINGDGSINAFDIEPFLELLFGP